MVSIIKNQLLKHLSRFTKNLSADKINLSTFKGEGELKNLELDEEVLTSLLELPAWVRLTSAWCNKVNFRIQWTKLKSVPIVLTLDEVHITVETCNTGHEGSMHSGISGLAAPLGKYSFIHKVIDGITVVVNTVSVTFKSPAFVASVQMSRIRVESRSPSWERSDLRMTRLKHPENGTLLTFKELEWQTVRIEASSTVDDTLTPLRLLTNQARCRITIKKRISDCMVLGSRLVLILDELLWVLTDCQLKAALHFLDSLAGLVQSTTNATQKTKAARKLELLPEYQAQLAQSSRPREAATSVPMTKLFSRYDVLETSYHFLSQGIDLHLCDDPGDGRSCHPHLKKGAALQISIAGFQVDYYPYHLAIADRKNWPKYREASTPPAVWQMQALTAFRNSLIDLVDPSKTQHNTLVRTNNQTKNEDAFGNTTPPPQTDNNFRQEHSRTPSGQHNFSQSSQSSSPGHNIVKNHILEQLSKLMTTCVILRIANFTLYRVTTADRKQVHKEFVTGDRDRYALPEYEQTIHAEFTYYYYPGDSPFPLPIPKFYIHVNPVQIKFDLDSCLWLNSFLLNLHQSLINSSQAENVSNIFYVDLKLEAIMTSVTFESSVDHLNQRDRPASLQFQVSRASISNVRDQDGSSRADLAQCMERLQTGNLVFGGDFPSNPQDYNVVTDKFVKHVTGTDSVRPEPPKLSQLSISDATSKLYRELLWVESRDVWCIRLDPVCADFFGARAVGSSKPVPLLDAVPITLWVHLTPKSSKKYSNTNIDHRLTNSRVNPFDDSRKNSLVNQSSFENSYRHCNTSNDKTEGKYIFTSDNYHLSNAEEIPDDSDDCDRNADIHVLACISTLVSLQINHYQFLFLLRLMEEVTELLTFLSVDSNRILKQERSGSMVIAGVMPQVEVTFVMSSQTPGKELSGDVESVIPDSASLAEDLQLAGGCPLWANRNSSDSTLKKSITSNLSNLASPVLEHPERGVAYDYSMSQSILSGTKGAGIGGKKELDSTLPNIQKEMNAGLVSMKKGFSSFMTYMDIKSNPDDMSDTMSIRSDVSSDSENYIMVNMQQEEIKTTDCLDAMFRLNLFTSDTAIKTAPVELGSEVLEEALEPFTNPSSPSEQSQDSCKRKDLVSMSTFKLNKVEFVQQTSGFKSSIKLQISGISCEECGCIPWDEFQSKFSSRSRAWLGPDEISVVPCVSLRMEHRPKMEITAQQTANVTDQKSVLSWFEDDIEIRPKDITLALNMSTVVGLADLVEDEIVPVPIPLEILLENINLHLIEDRPPANITSPGPIPIDLSIGRMRITRDSKGVFHIQPLEAEKKTLGVAASSTSLDRQRDKDIASLQITTRQLRSDNDELRRRLGALDRLTEENRSLQKAKEEVDILKSYLAAAQDDVTALLDEKKTLLDTVKVLQEQLNSSERHSQTWNSKR